MNKFIKGIVVDIVVVYDSKGLVSVTQELSSSPMLLKYFEGLLNSTLLFTT